MEGYEDLIAAFSASCRVDAKGARGSCTIIYSKEGETFALTNFHVIANNIKYGTAWDPLLQMDKKTELRDVAQVLFPRLDKNNDIIGYATVNADIVMYHKEQDIALLKFRDETLYPVVKWYSKDTAKNIPILSKVIAIGAALGQKPIVTEGFLNGKQIEIDNYEYWMSGAQSIFGNSGGGLFVLEDDKWFFLGIPSRIAVQPMGFTAQAITHMGYFIPLHRIYGWLDDNCYEFLYDNNFTSEQCRLEREEKAKNELVKLLAKQE
jgi:S1-C subfamily serine protease